MHSSICTSDSDEDDELPSLSDDDPVQECGHNAEFARIPKFPGSDSESLAQIGHKRKDRGTKTVSGRKRRDSMVFSSEDDSEHTDSENLRRALPVRRKSDLVHGDHSDDKKRQIPQLFPESVFHHMDEHGGGSKGRCAFSEFSRNRFQSNRCAISTGPSSPVIISSGSNDSESEENNVSPDLDMDVAELTWKLKAGGKAAVKREKPVVPTKTNKTLGDATATSPFKETCNKTCVEKEKDSTRKDIYENRFQSNRCTISTGPSSPVIISSGSSDSESEENSVLPDLDVDVAELTWKLKADGKASVKREKPVVPAKTNKTLGDATATSPFKETSNKTCVEKEKDSTCKDTYENRIQSNRCTISTGPSSPVIISSGSSDSESEENSVLPDLDVDVAELTWKLKADGKASVKREKPVVPAKTNKTLEGATVASLFEKTSNKTVVEKKYSTREDIQAGDGTFVASGYKYDGMQCRLKRVKFLQGFSTFPAASDRLYVKLTERQTACLMDLLHDVSDSNSTYCMDMLLDFCCRGKPPVSVMDKLVNCAFCNLLERALNIRVYNVILKLWQLHPDLIRLDPQLVIAAGDVLQNHLKQCDPSHDTCSTPTVTQRDCSDPDSPTALQAQLYFKLFTKGLQLDLSQRKLADWGNVTKSQAYCCLSPDSSKKLMNKLIQWLEFCLTVRHLQHAQHCRWWISELQSLLGVCVLVSRDRQSTAKMLASALKQIYAVMPDLSAKKQLLQNFSCPLLCFFLVSLVMGEQCKHTIISSEFPSSICEFTDKYYSALPPEHQMTSSCDISPEHAFAHRHIKYRHSVQSCEELAMLVFFISKSYLACRQRRLYGDLRQQILKGPHVPSLLPEEREAFQRCVKDFCTRLQDWLPVPSRTVTCYLDQLNCLCLCT